MTPVERDAQLIADAIGGMRPADLVKKYAISANHVYVILSKGRARGLPIPLFSSTVQSPLTPKQTRSLMHDDEEAA